MSRTLGVIATLIFLAVAAYVFLSLRPVALPEPLNPVADWFDERRSRFTGDTADQKTGADAARATLSADGSRSADAVTENAIGRSAVAAVSVDKSGRQTITQTGASLVADSPSSPATTVAAAGIQSEQTNAEKTAGVASSGFNATGADEPSAKDGAANAGADRSASVASIESDSGTVVPAAAAAATAALAATAARATTRATAIARAESLSAGKPVADNSGTPGNPVSGGLNTPVATGSDAAVSGGPNTPAVSGLTTKQAAVLAARSRIDDRGVLARSTESVTSTGSAATGNPELTREATSARLVVPNERLVPSERVTMVPPDVAAVQPPRSPEAVRQQRSIANYLSGRVVEFEVGRDNLTPAGVRVLDRLVPLIQANAGTMITIQGHTDDVGDDASNLDLSSARAIAARRYLISKGISPPRLRVQGLGERFPIADNNTTSGRIRNRRIDFAVSDAG